MNPISIETLAGLLGAAVTRRITPSDNEPAPVHITGVSTDSRTVKPGDCFFAISGEQFDGHDYVAEVFRKGAVCAVVCRPVNGEPIPGPILGVRDSIQALGELARQYRTTNAFKVVAITGSVGKTTTRQIVHHVLSRRFRTHQAQRSFNNNIGLPLTLLGAESQDEVIVAELGSNHPGEIGYLARITRPDIALVTNAHPAHLEGFGDLATIVREKLSIADGLADSGVLIVNADIEPLVAACRSRGRAFLTFGKSANADYRAQHIAYEALHSTFVIRGTQVRLPLPGPGNVENALAAWAVCDQLGLNAGDFAQAVESLHGVTMRAEPVRIGTLTVLNDCYNANPASMKNALAMLRNLRPGCDGMSQTSGPGSEDATPSTRSRLVFICGEMAELGPQAQSLHAELGAAVAEAGVDLLITIGELPRIAAQAAQEASRNGLQVRQFDDTASACDCVQDLVRKNDIILVKGSRVARLERVVEKLIKNYG